jgi:acetolactate synthase II small subunit
MATRTELALVVRRVEGVLVRVLGATVRRGFEPVAVRSALGPDAATFELFITVESDRPAAGLARHLLNLYDVQRVEVGRDDRIGATGIDTQRSE